MKNIIAILFILFLICIFNVYVLAAGELDSVVNANTDAKPANSVPASKVPAESQESNHTNLLENIKELKPESFSGIFTNVILIILSIFMLYFKFGKGNTNSE